MNPWNSAPFQGRRRTRHYFEGWYFKQVAADLSEAWAVIPGISRGENEADSRAFVQVIEGRSARSWWFEYPASEFEASTKRLDIRVGPSRFSLSGLALDLEGAEGRIRGELAFGPAAKLPPRLLAPGVMGPYSFVPRMECSHGLVSLSHRVDGWIETEGRRAVFREGRGYAEKDWGSSMPERWIWTQSNSFSDPGLSFMFSLARIPWLGSAFDGFLCVAQREGRVALEASWTGARVQGLRLEDDSLSLSVLGRKRRFDLRIRRGRGGLLKAPLRGLMSRRIAEAVDVALELSWQEGGRTVLHDRSALAGLEVVGDARAFADPSREDF